MASRTGPRKLWQESEERPSMDEALRNVDKLHREREKTRKRKRHSKQEHTKSEGEQSSASTLSQVERARKLFDCTRALLYYQTHARDELKRTLRAVDKGESVDLHGIAAGHQHLFSRLHTLLQLAGLKECKSGVFQRSSSRDERLLPALAPAFDETPQPPEDPNFLPDSAQSAASEHSPAAKAQKQEGSTASLNEAYKENTLDDEQPGGHDGNAQGEEGSAKHTPGRKDAFIGPTMGPAAPTPSVGPTRPPDHILEQAKEQMDNSVGPAPPEVLEEDLHATQDTRKSEVERILSVQSASTSSNTTAYDMLAVPEEASNRDVKKQFHKLSLLVHPDKCIHPRAREAFNAVSQAKDTLLDATSRQLIDSGIKAKRDEYALQKAWEQRVRDAQWRRARGTATADDTAILNPQWITQPQQSDGKPQRQEWMVRPPDDKKGGSGAMPFPTGFAQQSSKEREGEQGFTHAS